jgi:cell division protein FtsI/penicillin-binding protein 2
MRMDRRTFLASLVLPQLAARTQSSIAEIMAPRKGSALLIEVSSGKLVASNRVDSAARRLVHPGSVIKPFVLAALIDSNIVRASTRRKCGRTLRINGRNLDCLHLDTGETLDPVNALAYSCNSYFAEMAAQLRPADLIQGLRSFGLTSSTKLTSTEVTGTMTQPADVPQLQLLALGESGIRVTPLEIATAYRKLALIKRESQPRAQQLSLVFDGLAAAAEYGTARLASSPSMRVAGKTGTAAEQTGGRTHAFFAGFAPVDRPEFVVVVFLETGSGGGDAAPIAQRIFGAI